MKRIIFSSVCAVALFGTNVYAATNWDELVKEWSTKVTTTQASYDALFKTQTDALTAANESVKKQENLLGNKADQGDGENANPNQLYPQLNKAEQAKNAALDKVNEQKAKINEVEGADSGFYFNYTTAKANLETAQAKVAENGTLTQARNTAGSTLAGNAESAQAASDPKDATDLQSLLKYYQDNKELQDSDGAKAAKVQAEIDKIKANQKTNLTQLASDLSVTFSTLKDTEYNAAVEAFDNQQTEITKDGGLQSLFNTAEKEYNDAKTVLTGLEATHKDLEAKYNAKATEVAAAEKTLADLQKKVEEATAALAEAERTSLDGVLLQDKLSDLQKELEEYKALAEQADLVANGKANAETALKQANDAKTANATEISSLNDLINNTETGLTKAEADAVNKVRAKEQEITTQKAEITAKQTALEGSNGTATKLEDAKTFADLKNISAYADKTLPTLDGKTQVTEEALRTALGLTSETLPEAIKTALQNYNGEVVKLKPLEDALGVASSDGKPATGLYLEQEKAQAALKDAQDKLAAANAKTAELEAAVSQAKAKVDSIDSEIAAAKDILANAEKTQTPAAKEEAKLEANKEALNDLLAENKEMSESTKAILKNNAKVANALADIATLASVLPVTDKDIFAGGLAELKAKEGLTDADKANIAKVEAKIKEALNEAAAAVAEEKKGEVSLAALGALSTQINNMNKRLGEIRGLNGDVGAWIRAYGTRTHAENGAKSKTYSTQIGADKKLELGGDDAIVGALFGYDRGELSAGKSNTYSLGIYGSYIANNGFFADAVLKYAKVKHKLDNANAKNQNLFLASIEGGYRFDVSDAFYVEPSLELITGRVSKYEAVSKDNTISVKSFTPFVLKPQAFFGANINDFTFRYGVGAVFNAHSAPKANINLKDFTGNGLAGESSIKLKKDNHGFASIGMAYKFSDNLRLNLGAEHTFGSKNKTYEFNSTLRYTF